MCLCMQAGGNPTSISQQSCGGGGSGVLVSELARRDGFEAGNADKIFQSTTLSRME